MKDLCFERQYSFSNNFYQNAFSAFAVEFAVKDFFPGPKSSFPLVMATINLAAHDSAFEMSIGVVFRPVMLVLGVRLFWRQFFKPALKIVVEPTSHCH